jgi:hypothetical protein
LLLSHYTQAAVRQQAGDLIPVTPDPYHQASSPSVGCLRQPWCCHTKTMHVTPANTPGRCLMAWGHWHVEAKQYPFHFSIKIKIKPYKNLENLDPLLKTT